LESILTVLTPKTEVKSAPALVTRQSWRVGQRTLTILLAEDNTVNQKLASRLLEKRGHRVVVAANGNQALDIVRKEKLDLIIMDVQMPEMDGLEATTAIRAMEKQTGRHLPIVALTAHAMTGDRERCLTVGMDGYVSKPIDAEELLAMIERLLPAQPAIPSEPTDAATTRAA